VHRQIGCHQVTVQSVVSRHRKMLSRFQLIYLSPVSLLTILIIITRRAGTAQISVETSAATWGIKLT